MSGDTSNPGDAHDDGRERLHIGVEEGMTTAEIEAYLAESPEYPEGTELVKHIEQIDVAYISMPLQASTLSKEKEEEELASIEQDDRVRYAEPEPKLTIPTPVEPEVPPDTAELNTAADADSEERFEPNDPMLEDQWDVEAMNLPEAWAQTTGSQDVVVAVVDNGVELDHPNLEEQFGEETGDQEPYGAFSHGTMSAGCVAATIDNGIGVAGTSDSRLRSYSVFIEGGLDAPGAITDAVDGGADLITMSMGSVVGSTSIADAVRYAYDNDVVFLTSAGNSGDDGVTFPATMEETIAVGASTESGSIAGFSSRGPEIDIAAPGDSVPTTDLDGEHSSYTGTSAACPEAAGVVALGLSENPDRTQNEIELALKKTATDLGEPEEAQGAGQVDAHAFLTTVTPESDPPAVTLELERESPGDVRSPLLVRHTDGDTLDTADLAVSVNGDPTDGGDGWDTETLREGEEAVYDLFIYNRTVSIVHEPSWETLAETTLPSVADLDTFEDQGVSPDNTVTVSGVSTVQSSTVVVTYPDDDEKRIAGSAAASNLDREDVAIEMQDTGGLSGEHTAWVFANSDLPDDRLTIGDDVTPIVDDALDSESATVWAHPGVVEHGVDVEKRRHNEDYVETDVADQINLDWLASWKVWNQDMDYLSYVQVPEDGSYEITLDAEYQSTLFIDGEGLLSVETGSESTQVAMEPGLHGIYVEYKAHWDMDNWLTVSIDGPGMSGEIPAERLYRSVDDPPEGKLTFEEQEPATDETVTVSAVTTRQKSKVVVTYTDGEQERIAGIALADVLDGADVAVDIEDAGGLSGEHTAWLFDERDLPADLAIGDDATAVADAALDSESATVTATHELSVAASGDTLSPGEQATITIEQATGLEELTIDGLWTDWEITETTTAGGAFEAAIETAGKCHMSWDSVQSSVSPAVTVTPPDRYVGGEYLLTVTASAQDEAVEDDVVLAIE